MSTRLDASKLQGVEGARVQSGAATLVPDRSSEMGCGVLKERGTRDVPIVAEVAIVRLWGVEITWRGHRVWPGSPLLGC